MAKQYDITMKNVMMWADNELEHVGRIVAVKDADLQYSYALSTVNGMAHLKDALDQLIKNEDVTSAAKRDLRIKVEQVVRVMNHLVKDFALDIAPIKAFNVKKVLGSLDYLTSAVKAGKANGPTNNVKPAVAAAAAGRGEKVFSTGESVPSPNNFNKGTYAANSTGVTVPAAANAAKAANNAAFNEAKRNGAALFENSPASASAAAAKAANNAAFNEAKRNGAALFENSPATASASPASPSPAAAPANAAKAAKKAANNAAFNEAKRNGAALFENSPAAAAPAKGGRRKGRGSRKSKGRGSRKSKSRKSRKSRR